MRMEIKNRLGQLIHTGDASRRFCDLDLRRAVFEGMILEGEHFDGPSRLLLYPVWPPLQSQYPQKYRNERIRIHGDDAAPALQLPLRALDGLLPAEMHDNNFATTLSSLMVPAEGAAALQGCPRVAVLHAFEVQLLETIGTLRIAQAGAVN